MKTPAPMAERPRRPSPPPPLMGLRGWDWRGKCDCHLTAGWAERRTGSAASAGPCLAGLEEPRSGLISPLSIGAFLVKDTNGLSRKKMGPLMWERSPDLVRITCSETPWPWGPWFASGVW